jgi:hypothetical protein
MGGIMSGKIFGPRKRRTRQHVIADLAVHHVEGFVLEEGHTAQRLNPDYGYDLALFSFDEQGCIEPGVVFFQLKAAESLRAIGGAYVFDLDIRDYNLWIQENLPVILILFDASRRRAYWLGIQIYFAQNEARRPKRGAKTVRVRIPRQQVVNRRAVARWLHLKRAARKWAAGGEP